jgi:hypothetical protein
MTLTGRKVERGQPFIVESIDANSFFEKAIEGFPVLAGNRLMKRVRDILVGSAREIGDLFEELLKALHIARLSGPVKRFPVFRPGVG